MQTLQSLLPGLQGWRGTSPAGDIPPSVSPEPVPCCSGHRTSDPRLDWRMPELAHRCALSNPFRSLGLAEPGSGPPARGSAGVRKFQACAPTPTPAPRALPWEHPGLECQSPHGGGGGSELTLGPSQVCLQTMSPLLPTPARRRLQPLTCLWNGALKSFVLNELHAHSRFGFTASEAGRLQKAGTSGVEGSRVCKIIFLGGGQVPWAGLLAFSPPPHQSSILQKGWFLLVCSGVLADLRPCRLAGAPQRTQESGCQGLGLTGLPGPPHSLEAVRPEGSPTREKGWAPADQEVAPCFYAKVTCPASGTSSSGSCALGTTSIYSLTTWTEKTWAFQLPQSPHPPRMPETRPALAPSTVFFLVAPAGLVPEDGDRRECSLCSGACNLGQPDSGTLAVCAWFPEGATGLCCCGGAPSCAFCTPGLALSNPHVCMKVQRDSATCQGCTASSWVWHLCLQAPWNTALE
nr:uncharacterized protein LOC105884029 [Microcebus murinus]